MTTSPASHQLAEITFSESIPPFAKIMGITVFAVLTSRFLLHKGRVDVRGGMPPHAGDLEGEMRKQPCTSVAHDDRSESLPSDPRVKRD
jgi:hypothetical protein